MRIDEPPSRRRTIAATAAVAVLAASAVTLTALSYGGSFTATDVVTVSSERAGLVMEPDAKVKYLGVQVGNVESIDYAGEQAQLTLTIRRDQLSFIPSNAIVKIASNTVFGAKAVEFIPPAEPSPNPIAAGAHLDASAVSVEVNTLFQTLVNTLHKINPAQLNATLTAISTGLRGNGADLGAMLSTLNDVLQQFNPRMPTLQADLATTAQVANNYADASPDVLTALDNVPAISTAIVDSRENLTATLLGATGLAEAGYQVLAPAENDLIAAVQRLRAPLKVMSDYSPQIGCVFKGLSTADQRFGPTLGGLKPGLFISASFIPGVATYTYPESLPMVNASGGPNCRGLPDIPTRQYGGSFYRPPFLVTDNAYVPYQPNTELQFDAPSTLQFLFNGAYAERDDY